MSDPVLIALILGTALFLYQIWLLVGALIILKTVGGHVQASLFPGALAVLCFVAAVLL